MPVAFGTFGKTPLASQNTYWKWSGSSFNWNGGIATKKTT